MYMHIYTFSFVIFLVAVYTILLRELNNISSTKKLTNEISFKSKIKAKRKKNMNTEKVGKLGAQWDCGA